MSLPEDQQIKLAGVAIPRRCFIKGTSAAALAAVTAPLAVPRVHGGATAHGVESSSAVERFYQSLSDSQKDAICLPVGSQLRRRINPNWHVTEPTIGSDFYTEDQRKLIDEIVRKVTSEDGYERLVRQMASDTPGGMNGYSVGFFGKPGEDKHQWIMTGRHLTLRADTDKDDRTAFGGPIVYGHGIGNPKRNLFHYQTQKANEVFQALDATQSGAALLKTAPREGQVQLRGDRGPFQGVHIKELTADQRDLVQETLGVLMAPYRPDDVEEAMSILNSTDGMDQLRMAFYQDGDLGSDQLWDMWRIEGPNFVWSFRGAPHVHAYINIAAVERSGRGTPAGKSS